MFIVDKNTALAQQIISIASFMLRIFFDFEAKSVLSNNFKLFLFLKSTKGQLISKCTFIVFKCHKKHIELF